MLDNLFFDFNSIKERVSNVQHKEILETCHDTIISKQKEILNMLKDNLKSPISYEEFLKITEGDTHGDESSGTTQENRYTDSTASGN